ncbi:Hypothetical protein SCF082_LOCUS38067 [Durusdinium trenchii]|uniref:ubiquitinyl hydrolase 1 n=1 Tax=Durusdinium trenchii TaxID=1381693 RepID=A0ABP0PUQ5_9DINO
MARAGVPLPGILAQMSIQGESEASRDAFEAWFAQATGLSGQDVAEARGSMREEERRDMIEALKSAVDDEEEGQQEPRRPRQRQARHPGTQPRKGTADLRSFCRMARSGVPLEGIVQMMQVKGVDAESQAAFRDWFQTAAGLSEEEMELSGRGALPEERRLAAIEGLKQSKDPGKEKQEGERAEALEQAAWLPKDPRELLEGIAPHLKAPIDAAAALRSNAPEEVLARIRKEQHTDPAALFEAVRTCEQIPKGALAPQAGHVETKSDISKAVPEILGRAVFGLEDPSDEHASVETVTQSLEALLEALDDEQDLAQVSFAQRFAQSLEQLDGDPVAQANAFRQAVAALQDDESGCFVLGATGKTTGLTDHFAMLVTPNADGSFQVAVCVKHPDFIAYHPQKFDEKGLVRVCPVLHMARVRRVRLLDPTFACMTTRLLCSPSTYNSSRVLYEVLLPFLTEDQPLHQALASQYSGEDVLWWCRPGRAKRASAVSAVFVALRWSRTCLRKQDKDSWLMFKFGMRCHVADLLLEVGDLSPAGWEQVTRRFAKSISGKPAFLSRGRDLVERLSNRADQSLQNMQRLRDRRDTAWDLSYNVESVADVAQAVRDSEAYREASELMASQGSAATHDASVAHSKELSQHWDSVHNPEETLARRVDALLAVVTAYRENPAVVTALVQHAIACALPVDPHEWMTAPEWANDEAAQCASLGSLLQLAHLFLEACVEGPVSSFTADGDRVVVMACLFAWSNAVALHPEGVCASSFAMRKSSPNADGLNGVEFNTLTAALPTSPLLARARASIVPFLCRPGLERALWDFSQLKTKRAKPEFTLRVAAQIAGLDPDTASMGECAAAFSGDASLNSADFASLRDLAMLFKLASLPLEKLELRGVRAIPIAERLKWAVVTIKGETTEDGLAEVETFTSFAGQSLNHDHVLQRVRFESAASPRQYIHGKMTLASVIDEEGVLGTREMPTFSGFTGPEETERLLTLLTAPNIRIPAILSFFDQDRAALLFNPELRNLLLSVLLEPGPLDVNEQAHNEVVMCPQPLTDCPVLVSNKSLLEQELAIQGSPTVVLLVSLLEALKAICSATKRAPDHMLAAVADITIVLAWLEGLNGHSSGGLARALRPGLSEFFLERDMPGAFVATFLNAPHDELADAAADLVFNATKSLQREQDTRCHPLVREVLARHAVVLRDLRLPDDAIVEAVQLSQTAIEGTQQTWKRDGFDCRNSPVRFDLLSANVVVEGSFVEPELPVAIASAMPERIVTLGQSCVVADPETFVGSSVLSAAQLQASGGDLVQVALHKGDAVRGAGKVSAVLREMGSNLELWFVPKDLLRGALPDALLRDNRTSFWLDQAQMCVRTKPDDLLRVDLNDEVAVRHADGKVLVTDPPRAIMDALVRIEQIDHILFWDDGSVDLPRLGIHLRLQPANGNWVLSSNPTLHLDPRRNAKLASTSRGTAIEGLERIVILVNAQGEEFILAATADSHFIAKLDCTRRHLLGLDRTTALRLLIMKLQVRAYRGARQLVDFVATDQPFSPEEADLMNLLSGPALSGDHAPDAVALRLMVFEATFLRNRTTLPKNTSLFQDCVRYICNLDLVDPALRLSRARAIRAFENALEQGRPSLTRKRMASSDGEEAADFSSDLWFEQIRSMLAALDAQKPTQQQQTLVPLHGGGGWHRLKIEAPAWMQEVLDDDSEHKLLSVPLMQGGDDLCWKYPSSPEEIDGAVNAVLESNLVDRGLRCMIEILRSKTPTGTGLAFVKLLSSRMYLHKQKLQGTKMFEKTTFFLLAFLARDEHDINIPRAPEPGADYRDTVEFCLETMRHAVAAKGPAAKTFVLQKVASDSWTGLPDSLSVALEWFDLSASRNQADHQRTHQESPVLAGSRGYELLVAEKGSDGAGANERDGHENGSDHSSGEDVLFAQLLEKSASVVRARDDLDAFDNRPADPFVLVARNLEEAQGILASEVVEDREAIDAALEAIDHAVSTAFDPVFMLARQAPKLDLQDLMRLFVSKEGFAFASSTSEGIAQVLKVDLVELLERASALHLRLTSLRLVGDLLDALNSKTNGAPLAEMLLETLTRRRHHPHKPCLMVFEFEAAYLLRDAQMGVLQDLEDAKGQSSCRQMQMGGGKSSTILPLQALAWTNDVDWKRPTLVVVPDKLVEMSGQMLRTALGRTFGQRVALFVFSRFSLLGQGETTVAEAERLLATLRHEIRARSVILTTSSSLKAFVLKFVEQARENDQGHPLHITMAAIYNLLHSGRMLLDECDLLLHPLRSELNFPTGPKQDLAKREWRVGIASCLLDALSSPSQELDQALRLGEERDRLQRHPLEVFDATYFAEHLVPPLAKELASWIVQLLNTPDATLTLHTGSVTASADSVLGQPGHEAAHMLHDSNSFFCSAEYPHSVVVELLLAKPIHLGALDISFHRYSSFFSKSGLSMLPTRVVVSALPHGDTTWIPVAESGEFVSRRLYAEVAVHSRRIRIAMSGGARWFAIDRVKVHEVAEAQEAKAPRRRRLGLWGKRQPHAQKPEPTSANPDLADVVFKALLSPTGFRELQTQTGFLKSHVVLTEMGANYLHLFLPHCLGKVHSVSHGLLPTEMLSQDDSATRRYLSVPYVGKDTPAKASEFSHPDVLILLTLLAYRQGGLRERDVGEMVDLLSQALRTELGPVLRRKAWQVFDEIVRDGNAQMLSEGEAETVLPLHLFERSDSKQVRHLWKQVRHSPLAVKWFTEQVAFPRCLSHRSSKLVATGEDLTSLAAQVHGFSGTPNAALPRSLGGCVWEPLTEGKFLRVLTSSETCEIAPVLSKEVTARGLVDLVAQDKSLCALIDAGALVTGLSNREVATIILNVRTDLEGVVFLDQEDRKRILVRDNDSSFPLEASPILPEQRFTFYDQVHTTGMDIPQAVSGRAAITVSKDMTFRDFSQAAWRMRRLGRGQTLLVLQHRAVPELLETRVGLDVLRSLSLPQRLVLFLYLQGLADSEAQEDALKTLHVATLWRRGAMQVLAKPFSPKHPAAAETFASRITFDPAELEMEPSVADLAVKYRAFVRDKRELAELLSPPSSPRTSTRTGFWGRILRIGARKQNLDAEQQQERGLDAEQQQEREREQQAQTMGDLEMEQPRSWASRQIDDEPWDMGLGVAHGPFHELSSVLLAGGSESLQLGCDLEGILFSKNHTPKEPIPNSHLRNVQVAIVLEDGRIAVVSLKEANTLRWAGFRGQPFDLVLVDTGTHLGVSPQQQHDGLTDARLQVARFFDNALDFSPAQVAMLESHLSDRGSLISDFFTTCKSMRRRDAPTGAETRDGAPLKELFKHASSQ